jgi:hypothetical protein
MENGNHQLNSYAYISPDWGTMTWYTKKRYQRPMTMQEKLDNSMCRDCYVRYHANNIITDLLRQDENRSITNIQLASATLTGQCENPPLPPAVDDWFNWTGWFYANAKQDVLVQHDPFLLYTTNICNDLNVELCQQYYHEGLCYTAQTNHLHRHSWSNGTILTDHDSFVYNITQMCRQSCHFCPEDGYDTNDLKNGTRLSIFWTIPTWDNAEQLYFYDETSMYYDCTIIEVRDRPVKQYLIKYDDSFYNNEWFDFMTLRDLGYHFIPDDDNEKNIQSASFSHDESTDDVSEDTAGSANDVAIEGNTDDDDVVRDTINEEIFSADDADERDEL